MDEPSSVALELGARVEAARATSARSQGEPLDDGSPSTLVRAREEVSGAVPSTSRPVDASSLANGAPARADHPSIEGAARPARAPERTVGLTGKLGKYQLVASLGRGGMAEVMLALVRGPTGANKLTVLKILREDVRASSQDAVQLFVAEAQLAARFSHRNVVRTYEAAEIDGRYMLAMEYLEGQTYRHVQRRAAKTCGLLLHEHLRVLSQMARGLQYVHTLTDYDGEPLETVHRDVSPQNVFVTYDGEVKLLDFGIAQTRSGELPAQERVIKGKLDYMAPEQLKREPVDARADVFALGAMLWEAISGVRFAGGRAVSDYAKAQARVHGSEANIRSVQPNVPDALAALVDQALALSPADRLPDASSFADAVDTYLLAVGEPCPLPRGQEPRGTDSDSLPALMHSLFARDRTKLRGLVDRHLQRLSSEQVEAEEGSSERVFVAAVAEVETSGWTSIRDLSGQSGLQSLSRAGTDESTASIVIDAAELGALPAGVELAAAPELSDADEPTRPRIASDLSALSRESQRATLPPAMAYESKLGSGGQGRASTRARANQVRPSFARGGTHRPALARGTGNFERAHVRGRATTALLLAFGALSGGALAWFAPAAGVEPADSRTEVVVVEETAASSSADEAPRIGLPAPLAEPAVVHEPSLADTPIAAPEEEVIVTEPVVTEIVAAEPSSESAPAAASAPSVVSAEPRPDDTVGVPAPVDPPDTASSKQAGASDGPTAHEPVPQVVSAPPAAPSKPPIVVQKPGVGVALAQKPGVGVVHKAVVPAKKSPLARPAGAAVRAPAPVPFKATVERNPYLR